MSDIMPSSMELEVPSTPSTSKRGRGKNAATEGSPSKKPRTPKTQNGEKTTSINLPSSFKDLTIADRLIVELKGQKKTWPEIEAAWEKEMGKKPGKDVLRKRYPKLMAACQEWKKGDASKLAKAKFEVDQEVAQSIKQLEQSKWAKVADRMTANGADTYKPASIEKKWTDMVRAGEVDAAGNYVGNESDSEDHQDASEAAGKSTNEGVHSSAPENNADVESKDEEA